MDFAFFQILLSSSGDAHSLFSADPRGRKMIAVALIFRGRVCSESRFEAVAKPADLGSAVV